MTEESIQSNNQDRLPIYVLEDSELGRRWYQNDRNFWIVSQMFQFQNGFIHSSCCMVI